MNPCPTCGHPPQPEPPAFTIPEDPTLLAATRQALEWQVLLDTYTMFTSTKETS